MNNDLSGMDLRGITSWMKLTSLADEKKPVEIVGQQKIINHF